jgi:hypothetical protein
MKHPFDSLSAGAVRKIYWIFLGLTALVAIIMGELGKFQPEGAPEGTVRTSPTIDFEFANTPEKWNALQQFCGAPGMDALRVQTYVDYVFLMCYSTLIGAGVIGVSRASRSGAVRALAPALAWGQWLSGVLDGIENFGLLQNANGPVSQTWLNVTVACATLKFALIVIGVLFIFILMPLSWRDDKA